jgi:hypothetical protein
MPLIGDLCGWNDCSYPEAVDRPPFSVFAALAVTILILAGAMYVLGFVDHNWIKKLGSYPRRLHELCRGGGADLNHGGFRYFATWLVAHQQQLAETWRMFPTIAAGIDAAQGIAQ